MSSPGLTVRVTVSEFLTPLLLTTSNVKLYSPVTRSETIKTSVLSDPPTGRPETHKEEEREREGEKQRLK